MSYGYIGYGFFEELVDETWTPSGPTPCSGDSDCVWPDICQGGLCQSKMYTNGVDVPDMAKEVKEWESKQCSTDSDCLYNGSWAGMVCGDAGICTGGCRMDDHCMGGDICVNNLCVPHPEVTTPPPEPLTPKVPPVVSPPPDKRKVEPESDYSMWIMLGLGAAAVAGLGYVVVKRKKRGRVA